MPAAVERALIGFVTFGLAAVAAFAAPSKSPLSPTNIFAPVSTPAQSIFELSRLVLMVTAAIFIVVFSLLAYAAVKFRRRRADDVREPAQVESMSFSSLEMELKCMLNRHRLQAHSVVAHCRWCSLSSVRPLCENVLFAALWCRLT
jgi:hypothetical protein